MDPSHLRPARILSWLMLLAVFSMPAGIMALTPKQIAVVINGNSPGSWQVGHYYLKARHIPVTHLIVLNLANHYANDISPADYAMRIAYAIRQILQQRRLTQQIKCIVTTYGIPLRVGPVTPTSDQMRESSMIKNDLGHCADELSQGILTMQSMNPAGADAATKPMSTMPSTSSEPAYAQTELTRFRVAASAAMQRYQNLSSALQQVESQNFFQILKKYFGPGTVAGMMQVHGDDLQAMTEEEKLKSERLLVQSQLQTYQQLAIHRDRAVNRQKMRQLQLEIFGITGLTEQLLSDRIYLSRHGHSTAVDNDLMMLWYHAAPPILWHENPDYLPLWHQVDVMHGSPQAIMVSRLDGLTPEMVINMIKTSMEVQQQGLHGVAYFDARGLHGHDAYSVFDRDIRATVQYLKNNAAISVVLNDTPALLQAKNCPRAALYCGWYSVHHYVDSCQWLPGCVAYHVASFELTTLHNPDDTGWCVNLLKHGVVGTLGAVAEPYLQAFPKPSLFFPLLLCGKFTQAEVYFLTTPQVGWRIAYVGDPLYNPFQHDPRISPVRLKNDPLFAKAFLEIKALNY